MATSTSDSLVLLVRSGAVSVPMTAVTHLEYANGSDIGHGALRGLMQSVPLAGFYLALALQEQSTTTYRNGVAQASTRSSSMARLSVAAITAAIGAGLGAIFAPPQWVERRATTSLLVAPDIDHKAMRVGLKLRY